MNKSTATFLLVIFLIGQIAIISTGLFIPKPAQALLGIADQTFNIEIGNFYDIVKDAGLGALRKVALEISNKFLTRLVGKVNDKYKIRNFLYYDRVLSNYYLSRLLADKISDPDLRRIFDLMWRGYITGEPTGANANDPNAPDPRKAIIPQLKKALADYYIAQGGIDPNKVYYPAPGITDREYFTMAKAYFANPRSFSEQNLRGQFGSFQSSATTAAQLEILVGNGIKAGRVIGGTCEPYQFTGPVDPEAMAGPLDPSLLSGAGPDVSAAKDPVSCTAAGGKWQESALDIARNFIDNPTAVVDKYLSGAILTQLDANFNPNNFWAIVGSLFGSFLFNKLTLDRPGNSSNGQSGGILQEDPYNPYVPEDGLVSEEVGVPIDLDGDGVIDGYDNNGDGEPDVCVYGGAITDDPVAGTVTGSVGPPCRGSQEAMTGTYDPGTTPDEEGVPPPADALDKHPDQSSVVAQAKADLLAVGWDLSGPCGAFEIVKLAAARLGAGVLEKQGGNNCNGYSVDIIAYPDGYIYDVVSDAGGANGPAWQPAGCGTAETNGTCPERYRTVPEGGGGVGVGNDPAAPSSIDVAGISWIDADISNWSQTANLSASFSGPGTMNLNYDKANVWPAGYPLGCSGACGGDDALVANAWIVVWRDGRWQASTWEWMRPGQTSKGTSNLFAPGAATRGALSNFSAKPGDLYGFAVSGLARNGTRNVMERSNVVAVRWPA